MTEERQSDSTADTTGTTGDAVVSSGGQSVEEVEAFWRNRQSGIQRAHNAETAALQAALEAARNAPAPPPEGESADAARARSLEAELQQERAARQALTLQTQYPLAAGVLGEAIAALPPEKIAAMEAALDAGVGNGGPPMIDPNAARRGTGLQTQQQRPLNEKTKDELLSELRTAAPQFQADMMER